ncbi:hypothetical protein MMC26_005889 [Xylographa opegraphella]|nr:hypothetical protein [Xylographa opegraphella]
MVNGSRQRDPETRQWRMGYFQFGDLKIKESIDTGASSALIDQLGSIMIRAVYVVKMLRNRSGFSKPRAMKSIGEVSEKALKGRALSNTIKTVAGHHVMPPRAGEYEYEEITDSAHVPVEIEIFYRSKKILQMLDCIPSVEPIRLVKRIDVSSASGVHPSGAAESTLSDISPSPSPEIKDDRAPLALLEPDLNVNSKPVDTILCQSALGHVKREREYLHIDDDSAQKRRKFEGAIEVLDLAAD